MTTSIPRSTNRAAWQKFRSVCAMHPWPYDEDTGRVGDDNPAFAPALEAAAAALRLSQEEVMEEYWVWRRHQCGTQPWPSPMEEKLAAVKSRREYMLRLYSSLSSATRRQLRFVDFFRRPRTVDRIAFDERRRVQA